jgi:hypothetical protein
MQFDAEVSIRVVPRDAGHNRRGDPWALALREDEATFSKSNLKGGVYPL